MDVPKGGAPSGAIIAQGGSFGGWCLYCTNGVPAYCHNWVALERYYVRGAAALAPGKHTIRFEFKYDGGGAGKGGTGMLYVDGKKAGEGRIEHTVPNIFSYDDFADIGRDTGEPVTDEYVTEKGVFSGATIVKVTIDISGKAHHDPEGKFKALMAKQ